jgi:hypothetical protein
MEMAVSLCAVVEIDRHFIALMMEAVSISEISVRLHETTRRSISGNILIGGSILMLLVYSNAFYWYRSSDNYISSYKLICSTAPVDLSESTKMLIHLHLV